MRTRVRAPLATVPPPSQVAIPPGAPKRPGGAGGGAVGDLLLAALHLAQRPFGTMDVVLDGPSAARGAGAASVTLCLAAGYQLRAAPARDEAEAPAQEDEQPVLESDQIEEVHAQPEEPRQRTIHPDEVEIRHRAGAADRGQVALVAVMERRGLAAAHPVRNQAPGVAALLDRRGRHAGQLLRLTVPAAHAHHVSERDYLGMSGQRQVAL